MLIRLLRVSELRLQGAERRLQAARSVLEATEAAILRAEAEREKVLSQIERQRNLARELFVGSVQARVAVEDMLMDLGSFDRAENAAKESVQAAVKARDDAKPAVAEAQKARGVAQIKVDKRRILARQDAAMREGSRLAVEEADALEQWTAGRMV